MIILYYCTSCVWQKACERPEGPTQAAVVDLCDLLEWECLQMCIFCPAAVYMHAAACLWELIQMRGAHPSRIFCSLGGS